MEEKEYEEYLRINIQYTTGKSINYPTAYKLYFANSSHYWTFYTDKACTKKVVVPFHNVEHFKSYKIEK